MSSFDVIQEEGGSISRLEALPVEALIEILSHADFEAFDNMRLASRRLRSVIQLHFRKILPDILEREFSPVKAFFDALGDIHLPDGAGSSHLLAGSKTGVRPLLGFCRTIKRWEAEFPLLRFANAPENTRSLRPHERSRLRDGLYFWWRFARCFHGPAPCSESWNTPEMRCAFVRQLCITRLHEVWDTWKTVCGGVGRRVCPSVSAVRGLGVSGKLTTIVFFIYLMSLLTDLGGALKGESLTGEVESCAGWGDGPENADIVSTMVKLRPDEILHLLVYRHRYATKQSVVEFVRLRHPRYVSLLLCLATLSEHNSHLTPLLRIEDSTESFTRAILDVVNERNMHIFWPFPCVGFPSLDGGILDYKDPKTEGRRAAHRADYGLWAINAMPGRRLNTLPIAAPKAGRLEASS